MTVEFRCDHCGKLLQLEQVTAPEATCVYCGLETTVPEGLASLPTPRAEGDQPQQDADGAEFEEEEEVHEVSMFSGPASAVMSLIISVLFHAGLFLVMLFVVMFTYETRLPDDYEVPTTTLTDRPTQMADQQQQPREQTEARRTGERRQREEQAIHGGERGEQEAEVIGLGAAAEGGGLGEVDTGFGGGVGEAEFFGTGAMAYHIVYLIDASGSMGILYKFDAVTEEIVRSLANLQPPQTFNVMLYTSGEPDQIPHRRLTQATRENKARAAQQLPDVVPEGTTNPVRALDRAFDVLAAAPDDRPKLIMFLADGLFQGVHNREVLEAIRNRNSDGEIRINTYLYGTRDPIAMDVMEQIAQENNGVFKAVPLE